MLSIMVEGNTLSLEATSPEHVDFLEKVKQEVADAIVGKKPAPIMVHEDVKLNAVQIAAVMQYLPEKKIVAIKETREITGLGLKEAKAFVNAITNTQGMRDQKNAIEKLRREVKEIRSLRKDNANLRKINNIRQDPRAGWDLREQSEETPYSL